MLDRIENGFTGGKREWCRRGVESCLDAGYREGGRAEGSEVVELFGTDRASRTFRRHGRAPPHAPLVKLLTQILLVTREPTEPRRNERRCAATDRGARADQPGSELRHAHLTD